MRRQFPDGVVWFYEGDKGFEHKVRRQFPDGDVSFFEGDRGFEHMVRAELHDGTMWFYEGDKGFEHKVRAVLPSGETQFFKGNTDAERKVRAEFPDGLVIYYGGTRDNEYVLGKGYTAESAMRRNTQKPKKPWTPESEEGKAARVAKNKAMVAAMAAATAGFLRPPTAPAVRTPGYPQDVRADDGQSGNGNGAISGEMQASIDAFNAAETAKHRADSLRRAEVRRQAEQARANRPERPYTEPGPSGPKKADRARKNRAAPEEESRAVSRNDFMAACAAHEQRLEEKERLRLEQIEEQMENRRIAHGIMHGVESV